MTWAPVILAAAAVLTFAFFLVVRSSNRIGVGVIAREFDGTVYFLDTQILDPAYFQPGATDDHARRLHAFDVFLVPDELIARGTVFLVSPTSVVKITGLT